MVYKNEGKDFINYISLEYQFYWNIWYYFNINKEKINLKFYYKYENLSKYLDEEWNSWNNLNKKL